MIKNQTTCCDKKKYSKSLLILAVLVITTFLVSCDTSPEESPIGIPTGEGTIKVVTRTTGNGSDPGGYLVAIDDNTPIAIGLNDSVFFENVTATFYSNIHDIRLTDVDLPCYANNDFRQVAALIDDTVTVRIGVQCFISPGSIKVSVITGGSSPDDSYYVVLDGTDSTLVTTGNTLPDTVEVLIDNVLPGTHQVAIVDVAANCSVSAGNDIQTVEVNPNSATDVFFSVSCTGGIGTPDIVYITDDLGGSSHQIWIMDSTGNNRIQLTSSSVDVGFPRFSPDGTKIGYYQEVDYGLGNISGAIFIMNSDGTSKTNVTGPANLAMSLFCWSPDGTKIAGFGSKLDSLDFQSKLYTLDLNSNTVTGVPITNFSLFSGYYAIDWSPDGSKFLFHSTGPGGSAWTDIYTVSVNGGIATVLAADPSGGNGFFNPKWSPDGSMVSMHDGIGFGIWIVDNDGSNLTKIVPRSSGGGNPDWLPDGTGIGFTSSLQQGILVTDLSGNIVNSIATDVRI
jgi:dipeptidyl aminopeptidase/acylaminoacyl peptidase